MKILHVVGARPNFMKIAPIASTPLSTGRTGCWRPAMFFRPHDAGGDQPGRDRPLWMHPNLDDVVVLSGSDGDDAKPYQQRDVDLVLRKLEGRDV